MYYVLHCRRIETVQVLKIKINSGHLIQINPVETRI